MDDYLEYYDQLVNYIHCLSCDGSDREDVAQEAMLRCSQHHSPNPKAFLLKTAKDILIDDARRNNCLRKVDAEIEDVAEPLDSEPIDVAALLERLDRIDRLILTVAIIDGKGYKEAAKTAGLAYDAARQRGSRALKYLKVELQQAV